MLELPHFPTHANTKCMVAVALCGSIYLGSIPLSRQKQADVWIPVVSAVLLVIGLLTASWYRLTYRCKNTHMGKVIPAVLLSAVLLASTPLLASFADKHLDREDVDHSKARQRFEVLSKWLYIPMLLGLVVYVSMNRFDAFLDCEWKMRPTAVSYPTALLKDDSYNQTFATLPEGHLKGYIFWSIVIYLLVFGGSYGISLAI